MKRVTKPISLLLSVCIFFSLFAVGFSYCSYEKNEYSGELDCNTADKQNEPLSLSEFDNINYIDKEVIEKRGAVKRIREKETLNTYVFQNYDGTETAYLFPENTKYITESGEVKEKNLSLVKNESEGYTIESNDYNVVFPRSIKEGLLFEYKKHSIRLIPENDGILVKRDNSVCYQNVFGENTELRYTPLLNGIKEDIIITKYTGRESFAFVLSLDNMTLLTKDSCMMVDNYGEVVFGFDEIIAYDSNGRVVRGEMKALKDEKTGEFNLIVSIPQDFLRDEKTVYPVTIDPTIHIGPNSSYIQDAPVFSGAPDSNFGLYMVDYIGPDSYYGTARTAVWLSGLE